ncbi:RIPP1 protein, partial [Amia calva]|nr:RIPP1 protein [Amia calva]
PYARAAQSASGLITDKEQSFQHPVRLFWPKSKSYDYLYSCGEVLLKTFPVQATISFYEESNSEDEDEEEEEEEEEEDSKVEICQTREHHHKAAAAFPCYN